MMGYLSKYGIDFRIKKGECFFTRELDAQKSFKKTMFGAGYLISEKAAAEKAAAVQWELSNREKAIIRGLIV